MKFKLWLEMKQEALPAVEIPGQTINWIPDPIANKRSNITIMIDPQKLDRDWSYDQGYIPPGGGGAEIGGRRAGFEQFLNKNIPVEASVVVLGSDKMPTFINGRHRFSVLRDKGAKTVAITVPRREAAEFLRRYGP